MGNFIYIYIYIYKYNIYLQLNDRFRFPYYSRLVPSDMHQANTLVDIMVRYGWTYVTVIASKGSYGERGKEVIITYFVI